MEFTKRSLTGLLSLTLGSISLSAQGQIIPDSSLETIVEKQGKVVEIKGGQELGSNLFHSFQDFSLPRDNTAFFNNNLQIENILSRVTGGRISNIDGLIRANGSTNLFLLNPAGIVFGENARLDIGGSFLASTATGLLFDDGREFQANNSVPVLTINAPVGLNLRETLGDISSRGNLSSSKDLILSGNNLDLQGQLTAGDNLFVTALNEILIRDEIDRGFIGKAGNKLILEGNNIDLFILNNPASGLFAEGDLTLRSDRPISGDAHYYTGGDFRLEQRDTSSISSYSIFQEYQDFEDNLASWFSLQDPVVRSQGDVSFADYTGASLHILAGGNITISGDINITGVDTTANSIQETIILSNGKIIEIDGSNQPTLDIRGGVSNIELSGVTGGNLNPNLTDNSTGSNIQIGGTVNNPGGLVFLSNQYQPRKELTRGDITVKAIDTSNNLGDGGNVIIDSGNSINILDGINTSSIVNNQLVTVANLELLPTEIFTGGKGGAIALLAVEDILTGDLNTTAGINLDLITEVDTIDEANLNFPFPQGNLQVDSGGNISLVGNNLNLGNLNSGSLVAIRSSANALDNFSIVSAILGVDLAGGGDINLQAQNNLTAGEINSNVIFNIPLTANSETTPNLNLGVAEIFLTISSVTIGSGGDIFLEAAKEIRTATLNSSITVSNQSNNIAEILAENPMVANLENPAEAISIIDLLLENLEIERGGDIIIKSDRAKLGNINSSLNVTAENTVFALANANNNAVANALSNSTIVLKGTGDRPGKIILNVDKGLKVEAIDNGINVNAINNLDSQANSNGDNSVANADNSSSNTINFDGMTDLAVVFLNLNLPDLDLSISDLPKINYKFSSLAFNTCPTNISLQNQQFSAIKTARGLIYPARNAIVKNGQIYLTSQSSHHRISRSYLKDFNGCNK